MKWSIVENPGQRQKTIKKYLGSDFKVLSSIGHVRYIARKPKSGEEPIDFNNVFNILTRLIPIRRKLLLNCESRAEEVWLATDENCEGQAIAWHFCEALKLDITTTGHRCQLGL